MKSLRPHLYRYVPKYFAKKYPKYVSLMENFLIFLETKNSLNFFDGTTERDHSIYNNIIDFDKHAQIDNLPVKNKDILNAYFKEYATTLDFRNQVLSFDEETMRMLAKFSGMVFNTKSSWSSYNLLFAIISTYLFNGAERGVVFKAFFNEDFTFDTEDAPDFYDIITVSDITKFSYSDFIKNATGAYGFIKLIDTSTSQIYVDTYNGTFTTGDSLFNLAGVLLVAGITVDNSDSIGRNEIILSEYPLYKINIGFDGVEVDKNVITGKGTRPFEYQLISKSDLFVSGNFVSKLKSGFNPAGFKNEIIYVPEDIECETYYDSKIFSKVKFDVETYEPPEGEILILTLNDGNNLTFVGEFTDGVRYMTDVDDNIVESTDPSAIGFQVGYGNADGDINLALGAVSGSERYQILSENCDFVTIDSCPVGTTKIAIAGHIYNMAGVVKLGGETIAWGTASNLAVLILYDIQTKMIDFIKTSSGPAVTAGYYVKILDADDTYIYWLREQSGYYLTKITISDGTVAESSIFGTTTISYASGKASMCADADYCYVIYPYYSDKRRVMGIKIAKSTLALGTATDLAFSPSEWTESNNNSVCTDGTYLYWVQNSAFVDTQVVRSSMTIASQSIVATYHAYDAGNPPYQTLPYNAVYANSKLYVSMYDDSPAQKWTYDGTNKASVGGRLSLANGIILSSISRTLQKLSSSLAIDWNKDYTGDDVSGGGTVIYVNANYYYVGYSSGDFDGNNPTNTKYCAIIGKIDIDTGDI
jgi:hypothetical protein